MSPPPPPVFPIFLTPPAKESFPVVQSAHEHLRHASDTIHQHRYSLASQLKGFDNRWAHLFSVAPVLNKLTKGRQRPDEFRKNAQGLDDDVQVALEEARKRKYSRTRFADEQDSIIPGPPPSDTIYSKISRKVKALSSILERVERGEQAQPGASRTSKSPHVSSKTSSQSKQSKSRAKSPTKSPSEQSKARPSKLTVDQTSTRRPARVRKKDSRHTLFDIRSPNALHATDFGLPPVEKGNGNEIGTGNETQGETEITGIGRIGIDIGKGIGIEIVIVGTGIRIETGIENETGITGMGIKTGTGNEGGTAGRGNHEGKIYSPGNVGQPPAPAPPHPVLSAPPAPVIPSNMPPIYARFANGHKYEYENNADLEMLQPPVLPFVTERMEKRREAREQNDGRGRGRDRSNRSAHRRAGYNGYEDYTYSSTSTPVIPVMATLPNSSSDPINTNIVIPAPSSTRHLSRSRYPPPSSKASRSPYLHAREEYGYNGYNGYNDYNGYGRTGAEYQGDGGHRSPKSPLIMRSKFKENFSVLQSESGRITNSDSYDLMGTD
ncbi:hypothetical protein EV368DRAFT_67252 [Lentinula lateritia]|nr:hypothetical protein EV368DRAFT_67252 [Lentinula lateritia]